MLTMKSMNIDAVVNFPFPTPPDRQGLRRAEMLLTNLGALERATKTMMSGESKNQELLEGKSPTWVKQCPRFPSLRASPRCW
jgi:ATP-dependent RNA helicase DHX37/DHR1